MKIKLYNTLSKQVEEFKPIKPGSVGMYTCGITAYDHTHIGHMRTYVNTDVLRRMLEYNGLKVTQVENVTDVGHLFGDRDMGKDKLETTAQKAKKSAWEIAKIYEKEFFETMASLNVKRPTVVCRATEHIQEMIELVKRMEKNGFTYKTSDGIYFDTTKVKDYNRMSGMPLDKLREGARVEVNPEKKNPTDFALWKFSPKTGPQRQMEWKSPWGIGFPGWHIECSAMGMKYLGEHFDIHTGGEDHINVHHTNERAQNIASTGHPVVSLWFHNAFLMVEGRKMSKSLGNFFWLKDIQEKKINPLALRYLFLTAHYRSKLNFTWKGLASASVALERLKGIVWWLKQDDEGSTTLGKEQLTKKEKYRERFLKAINDDLKVPEFLALGWEVVKSNLSAHDKLDLLLDFDQVLGLRLAEVSEKKEKVPAKVQALVEKREKLRKKDQWEEADQVRQEIEKLGWGTTDTSGPTILKPKWIKKLS